ncbi:MAG TPA: hypothetical protein VHZ54_11845 [Solirubrobacterales bacterium]|jgi:hypothetical protein|nr:hypothetical protein [Solirubrobacterales bacterium]
MRAATGRNGSRDRELLTFVGRFGIVGIDQVMAAMGAGRTATYRRIAVCAELGLLERVRLLRDEPTVLRATRDGLDYVGLGLPVATIKPGLVRHHLRCAEVGLRIGRQYGDDHVLSEREFTWREHTEGRPLAAVEVGGGGRGEGPRMHRADLAILAEEGVIAVEVELTAKAPRRLEHLIRAWRMATALRQIAAVHYLCAPGATRRAVERAVAEVQAESSVLVGEVEG